MSEIVSVFNGIKPKPVMETDWMEVLTRIKSEKYRGLIEKGRTISDPDQYREYKKTLPAVTFCASFDGNRDRNHVKEATGFLIPDLDHLEDIDSIFNTIIHDENIWFVFRSPSGYGIKCGLRANGIKSDDDVKVFFDSCSRYFLETYGLKLDPACKDISRLTFISYDPDLFINESPSYFDISAWLKKPPEKFYMPPSTNNGWRASYGQKVLESCCREIAESQKGQQHNTRLRKARVIGGFIASGFIDEGEAMQAIESAVRASGAVRIEQAMKSVVDGIENGKLNPLNPVERVESKSRDIEFYCDVDEIDDVSSVSSVSSDIKCKQMSSNVSRCKQDVSENTGNAPQNIAAHIKLWIEDSTGCFTVDQLDREFCLTTRIEKNNRAVCLNRLTNKKLIYKDKRIKGKYHILNTKLDTIDLFSVSETPFPINLPFDLHRYIILPKKCIVILAGSSNAGKTALLLNILNSNLQQPYKKMYLMSEMGPGEYKDRVSRLDKIDLKQWQQQIIASERSSDFNGAIEHHNPDGITCIDFLEEVDGEYYRIATDIRNIYDSLGDGVAIIAIQKKTTEEYARGGQATAEKSRLYMTVDLLQVENHSIVCSLRIIKLKRYSGRNLQGHEIFFEIHSGSQISPLSDWQSASQANRSMFLAKLNNTHYVHTFLTVSGRTVGVNYKDYKKWVDSFNDPRLDEVVIKISTDSHKKSWLNDKNWFFQVSALIKKELDK